jgi:hypothetical protein
MRRKEIIELSLTIFLVVVLVGVSIRAVRKINARGARSPRVSDGGQAKGVDFIAADATRKARSLLKEETRKLSLKADPFTGASLLPSTSGPQLSGILWEEGRPLAIINGQIVSQGDRVGSKIVAAIEKDRVILSDGSQNSEILLP